MEKIIKIFNIIMDNIIFIVISIICLVLIIVICIHYLNQINPNIETKISYPENLMMEEQRKYMKKINSYLSLLYDLSSVSPQKQIDDNEIYIPAKAGYSGTRGLSFNDYRLEYTDEIMQLDKDWFDSSLHIFIWTEENELFNKKKRTENNYVLILDKHFLRINFLSVENENIVMTLYAGETLEILK